MKRQVLCFLQELKKQEWKYEKNKLEFYRNQGLFLITVFFFELGTFKAKKNFVYKFRFNK